MFEILKKLLMEPTAALNEAKKKKDMKVTASVLVISWLLIGIGIAIAPLSTSTAVGGLIIGTVAAVMFVFGILASVFLGFVLKQLMGALGGNGDYFEGLTVFSYMIFPLSVGLLISSVFSRIPILGGLLIFVTIVITAAMSLGLLFRSVKELFKVDMITAWIGISLLILVMVLAMWITAGFTIGTNLSALSSLFTTPTV